jgi:hypothetical protein
VDCTAGTSNYLTVSGRVCQSGACAAGLDPFYSPTAFNYTAVTSLNYTCPGVTFPNR